ncbi:saccharopine dehydrogenase family protein [Frondihabitans cladoniiphilus]|uniref:Saccharopine dehydrogenase NADP-binding domain-containing protein n=1 Tax=Frondihabitans cladoniiphilus TaxID=715785 RepID=A0ABP8W0W5_9MICO
MSSERTNEIWILGATGNVGRAIAARLVAEGVTGLVLIGRSEERLSTTFADLAGSVTLKRLASFGDMLAAVRSERPRVVVNLIGSYAETAVPLAEACMPGGSYVDLSIDNSTLASLVDLDHDARAADSIVIGGAGFGVLATEALVVRLCAGRPTPTRVQIDALSSYAPEEGVVGEAFAVTSVDVMTIGGRVYRNGVLTPVPLGSNLRTHKLPDGTTVKSAAVPSGELFAARQASGAPNIDFTSALAPTATLIRATLPLMSRLLKLPSMRRMMIRQMAAAKTKKAPRPRPFSWGHAVVDWSDGTTREAWLRAEDAMDYTADVLVAVVHRFQAGTAPRGAFTPAAAFGPEIATEAGATFVDVGAAVA